MAADQSKTHHGRGRDRGDRGDRGEKSDFVEKVIDLARVAKVVKGGRRFAFRAVVAIGNGNGQIGLGYGKSKEVMTAIQKAILNARQNMIDVKRRGTTIPHEITGTFKAARVLLKPASEGTGVIAGGPVRSIAECAGITNLLSKSLGASSKVNIAKATIQALCSLRTREEIAALRGKAIEEFKG